jgi:hypothetical protein
MGLSVKNDRLLSFTICRRLIAWRPQGLACSVGSTTYTNKK